jgi:hypothetical protein
MSLHDNIIIILEVEDEDSIEIMDWKIPTPTMEEFRIALNELGDFLDEMDGSELLEINPETETIVPIEEGVYEFLVTVDLDNESLTVNKKTKLTDEEAEKYYSELDLPEANL